MTSLCEYSNAKIQKLLDAGHAGVDDRAIWLDERVIGVVDDRENDFPALHLLTLACIALSLTPLAICQMVEEVSGRDNAFNANLLKRYPKIYRKGLDPFTALRK